jgi:hypothetical protein
MPPEEPIPPPLEPMARRTFSFYPPILNVEHNEWKLRKTTWSEILVTNAKCDVEVWIPRRVLGEISQVDEPVMIVGLAKELEYKAGAVWPHERRVIEMPATPAPPPLAAAAAPLYATSGASPAESRAGRLIAIVLGAALFLFLVVALVYRIGPVRNVQFTAKDQDYLSLSHADDYFAVVRKLGTPAEDRWRPKGSELQVRALWYPERSYHVILLGPDRGSMHYIGAVDRNWRLIHYVDLPGGRDTGALLRGLGRF